MPGQRLEGREQSQHGQGEQSPLALPLWGSWGWEEDGEELKDQSQAGSKLLEEKAGHRHPGR